MFRISNEVKKALAENRPVVALESTVISHGLPYPHNLEVTASMQDIIRKNGAVPAIIALVNGEIVIGLEDIELFANSKDILKISRADISYCLQQKRLGATTVSATMFAANKVGIKVFATGGIGGVHRDVFESLDISTDLFELAKTPVAVVCSGVKSILDVPKTIEYLETIGVPILGYKTNKFPLFYSNSGPLLKKSFSSPADIAEVIATQFKLGLGGVLVANPIPDDFSLDANMLEEAIISAEKLRKEQNISGKEVTPFLLKEIAKLTKGKSLKSNIELLKNNALVAALVANSLSKLSF